jgi:hypothetical protein
MMGIWGYTLLAWLVLIMKLSSLFSLWSSLASLGKTPGHRRRW